MIYCIPAFVEGGQCSLLPLLLSYCSCDCSDQKVKHNFPASTCTKMTRERWERTLSLSLFLPVPWLTLSNRSTVRTFGGIWGIGRDCLPMPLPLLQSAMVDDLIVESSASLHLLTGDSTLKPGGGLAMPDNKTPVAFFITLPPTDATKFPVTPADALFFFLVLFDSCFCCCFCCCLN